MKSSSTTKPWKEAQAPIMDASKSLANTYNQTAPGIQQAADSVSGLLPGMVDKYKQGDAGIDSARDYNVDVLSGNYLNGNPHLQQMIDQSNGDLRNQMQASLGSRGLTGGSSYFDILSRNIGQNTNKLRYQDYDAERGRMATAAGQSPGIAAGDAARLEPLLAAAGITTMPLQAAGQYAGGVGGLLGNYTKQTQSQGIGGLLGGIAGAGLSGWASGGFKGF